MQKGKKQARTATSAKYPRSMVKQFRAFKNTEPQMSSNYVNFDYLQSVGSEGKRKLKKYERTIYRRIREEETKKKLYNEFGFIDTSLIGATRNHDFEKQQNSQGALVTMKEIKKDHER